MLSNKYYQLSETYESYKQPYEDLDVRLVLLERHKKNLRPKDLAILSDDGYSDIILVFDLDPQDPIYKDNKILKLMNHFSDSTTFGRLYINYPMVESFYHLNPESISQSIEDPNFLNLRFSIKDLSGYKALVNKDGFKPSGKLSRTMWDISIISHLKKASYISGLKSQTWRFAASQENLKKKF